MKSYTQEQIKHIDEISQLMFKKGYESCREKVLAILNNPKNWEYIDNETQTLVDKALHKLRSL